MAGAPAEKLHWLLRIDRRIIYLVLLLVLLAPLVLQRFTTGLTMKPAPLPSARKLFDRIEAIARERDEAAAAGQPWHKVVILSSDVEPQTRAELYPQEEAVVRHLMMRRVPFVVITFTPAGAGYAKSIPEKVARELGREYGQDWVNFGYLPVQTLSIQQMAKDVTSVLKADADHTAVKDNDGKTVFPPLQGIKDAGNVALVIEISGLVGSLSSWVDYFANDKARPDIANGCTAVSVPDSFAYLESRQIVGLLEGIAGAAAYNEFLEAIRKPGEPYPSNEARLHMTGQTAAHVLIGFFVILGNLGVLWQFWTRRRRAAP